MGSAVCHWLVGFLLDPARLRQGAAAGASNQLARVYDGRLHVNVRALAENWQAYPTNLDVNRATAGALGKALSSIAESEKVQKRIGGNGTRAHFHVIRTEDLIEWATATGYVDESQIRETLGGWRDE
jgi:hypothetical protein